MSCFRNQIFYCCTSAVSSTRSKSQIFSISSAWNVPERRKVLGLKAKQSQDQRGRRSMNFIQIEGKISPKVTRARGSINPRKAKRIVLHLWMCQHVAFLLFSPWLTTAKTCAPETWLRHHRFPAKLKFACCQRWGRCYFIGSRLFKLTHSSVRAWYVYKSLEGENSHSFFDRIPSP